MQITFKLYATLSKYLPEEADKHAIKIDISDSDTAYSLLDKFNVPRESAHLVLLNGVYLEPEARSSMHFTEGDTLAIWPPVAGG